MWTSSAICFIYAKLCKTTQNSYGNLLKPCKPKENAKSLIFKKYLTEEERKKNKVGFRFASND